MGMVYSFTKRIMKELGKADMDSYKITADKMIKTAQDNLGVCPISGDEYTRNYFLQISTIIKEIRNKYSDKALPEVDRQIDALGYNTPSVSYCVFWTFLLMNNGKTLFDEDYYLKLYKDLCKAVNHDFVEYGCMNNVLLTFCLKRRMSWEDWIGLNQDWSSRKNNYEGSRGFQRWSTLSYKEFEEITKKGLKENGLETQSSYDAIREEIDRSVIDYSLDLEEFKTKIFETESVNKIERSEWRRTWYLYRLISKLINDQIASVEKRVRDWKERRMAIKNYIRVPSGEELIAVEKAIQEAIESCALKIPANNLVDTMKKCDSSEDAVELFREATDKARISIERIQAIIDEALVGYECAESVRLVPYKRFIYHYRYRQEGETEEDHKRRILAARRACGIEWFNSLSDEVVIKAVIDLKYPEEKKLGKKPTDFISLAEEAHNTRISLANVMAGTKKTTKELLLLFALVVRAQNKNLMRRDYVTNHLLHNCRFNVDLNKEERFLSFFNDAFAHIDKLSEKAMAYEKEELELGNGAVFHRILKGV